MSKTKYLKYGLGAFMIGLSAYVIAYVGKQAKLIVGTVIEYAGVSVSQLSLQNVALTLFFKVINNSDIKFTVQNQTWKFYIDNNLVKELTNPNKVDVMPHSDTRLPIYLNFSLAEALELGIANFGNVKSEEERKQTKVKISGVVTVGTSIFEVKKIPIEWEDNLQNFMFGK